jgi:6-phosphogluconate dehydrogenase
MSGQAEFGMIGLGTMGRALLMNIADHGFCVAGWNRSQDRLDVMRQEAQGMDIQGFTDLKAFVETIRKPRVVMLLVPAGEATDEMIQRVVPLLEPGDFIIDGSNAYYKDTDRRAKALAAQGFGFLGLGVSGGESGARYGPSMMAGGTAENYERVRPVLEAAAAKYNGEPCVARLGPSSAGHYVKMVHNGIEYGIMQIIAECYDILRRGLGMTADEIADVFHEWNVGPMKSFLLEITEHVLRQSDEDGTPLVDVILDKAKSKGTGKWTSQDAMDLGIAIPTIDAAVNARELSALKDERVRAEQLLGSVEGEADFDDMTAEEREAMQENLAASGVAVGSWEEFTEAVKSNTALAAESYREDLTSAMILATVIAYAQGLAQLREASKEYGYDLDLQEVAKVWRAGCIIRSEFLEQIRIAFANQPDLVNLLVDPHVVQMIEDHEDAYRSVLSYAIESRIPVPALSASIAYLDGYRSGNSPANLIQAQRDLFGAHTYERTDKAGSFHTEWGYE